MQKHNTLATTVSIPPSFLLGAAIISAFFLALQVPNSYIATPVALLYILLLAFLLGKVCIPNAHTETQWLMGGMLLLCYYVIVLTCFFYLYHVTPLVIGLSTAVSPFLVLLGLRRLKQADYSFTAPTLPLSLRALMPLGTIVLVASGLLLLIIRSRTFASVVSPWPLLPPFVFSIYGVLTFITLLSCLYAGKVSWKRLLPLFALSFSITAILFPLGYGFDPFIHQATERILISAGTIQPQPLYYIGYYVLIAWLTHITSLPLESVDTYASIALAILLIPLAVSTALRYLTREKKYALITSAALLLLPYSFLIQGTPQAASFVVAIIFIFIALQYLIALVPWWILLVLSLSAACMHPLTGAPLIIMAFFFLCYNNEFLQPKIRNTVLALLFALGVCIIPGMIIIAAGQSSEFQVQFAFNVNSAFLTPFMPFWYRYTHLDDLIYTFSQSAGFLWILFSVGGLVRSDRDSRRILVPFAVLSGMLLLAYFSMSAFLTFNFSTSNEQHIFAQRIAILSLLVAAPLALSGIYRAIQALAQLSKTTMLLCILLLSLGLTVSWYASYPHFDTREQHTGYSASRADYQAVQWIHTDGGDTPYIVLANQTVSGVALKSFGFTQYHNALLYYPLPTNGPLYQKYLEAMNTNIDLEKTLAETRILTGVNRVYVVLDDYWNSADTLRTRLADTATRHYRIADHGQVDIFMYEVP